MPSAMTEAKETAAAHMQRDSQDGGRWGCSCEACRHIRSLIGVDKMLDVRPIVRAIEKVANKLDGAADGPDRRELLYEYHALYDYLADVMARE
jgi:hypothetical protein